MQLQLSSSKVVLFGGTYNSPLVVCTRRTLVRKNYRFWLKNLSDLCLFGNMMKYVLVQISITPLSIRKTPSVYQVVVLPVNCQILNAFEEIVQVKSVSTVLIWRHLNGIHIDAFWNSKTVLYKFEQVEILLHLYVRALVSTRGPSRMEDLLLGRRMG